MANQIILQYYFSGINSESSLLLFVSNVLFNNYEKNLRTKEDSFCKLYSWMHTHNTAKEKVAERYETIDCVLLSFNPNVDKYEIRVLFNNKQEASNDFTALGNAAIDYISFAGIPKFIEQVSGLEQTTDFLKIKGFFLKKTSEQLNKYAIESYNID